MLKKIISFFVLMTLVFTGSAGLFAQEDVEGSEDHLMISRYEGGYIRGYEQVDYDRLTFYSGEEDGEIQTIQPEGEMTRILYFLPSGLSVLQVQRNYQMALKDAGFEMVYEGFGGLDEIPREIFRDFDLPGGRATKNVFLGGKDASYFMARLSQEDGDIYVSAHTMISEHADEDRQPATLLQVLEEKPMTTGKVKVDISSKAMAEDIEEKGSVRLYGIHFDTDKATIKEKSESTLVEIAKLLNEKPDLNVGVVGHTSTTGTIEHNMTLSEQRAGAVVDFLTSEYGISKDRLTSEGVGPFAPVASNKDEDGRARNRRVELIELPQK